MPMLMAAVFPRLLPSLFCYNLFSTSSLFLGRFRYLVQLSSTLSPDCAVRCAVPSPTPTPTAPPVAPGSRRWATGHGRSYVTPCAPSSSPSASQSTRARLAGSSGCVEATARRVSVTTDRIGRQGHTTRARRREPEARSGVITPASVGEWVCCLRRCTADRSMPHTRANLSYANVVCY